MQHKHTITFGILLITLIGGMFLFAYLKSIEINEKEDLEQPINEQPNSSYESIVRIDAKHFFINGTHTIVGEIALPTPCDLLNWNTRIAESYPEQVTIDFSVINNTKTCAQVETLQRFTVSFSASENATIKAILNGRMLELNLIPPAPGETPESYEIFLKG